MTPIEALAPPTSSRARDAAVSAASETLLNCFLREGGLWRVAAAADLREFARPGDSHVALLPLRRRRAELVVGVRYRSATQRHRFRTPACIVAEDGAVVELAFDALAELLVDELAPPDAPADAALDRVRASVEAVTRFLDARAEDVDRLWGPEPLGFVESEQALLLGHMLHPTPKSRTEMSADDVARYSPELRSRFALHWLAVDPAIVEHDSATGTPAPVLARRLLRDDPAPAGLGERVLVPAHPWELAYLRDHDASVAALLRDGAIVDLGPLGSPVTPTSSVRTVVNDAWPYQLKFSLHVRVTNSLRVTLPKELRRAVEAARLLETEIGARAAAIAPRLVMLQDVAYLAVRHDGHLIDGLSVLLREHRWAGGDGDVSALATLCQDHPYGGRSRLGRIVGALAQRSGRDEATVAREWFARYCAAFVVPTLRLFGDLGLCLEPHQQNVLLELDGGWPARAVYRDSQGYFHREAAHDDIAAIVPGIGEASESIFPEALADERLVYYPFLNNAVGVVNALGVAGCVDELVLLRDLRDVLERERARGARYPATLLDRLLDDATWPCKANLRTRIGDLDELAGDFAAQSVYVTIPNPLRGL